MVRFYQNRRGGTREFLEDLVQAYNITWKKKGDRLYDGSLCLIDEIEFAYMLSQEKDFQHGRGISYVRIGRAINQRYHGQETRTAPRLKQVLKDYMKSHKNVY